MVAGEPSGDLLAGLLLDGLKARWPDLQAVGIGGPHMLQRGFQAWWAQSLLAVRGYAEVLAALVQAAVHPPGTWRPADRSIHRMCSSASTPRISTSGLKPG
jgi:lipid A disaccharide synthetase